MNRLRMRAGRSRKAYQGLERVAWLAACPREAHIGVLFDSRPASATVSGIARCAQIESVLAPRASRFSSRLTYLEFDEWDDVSEDGKTYRDVTPKPMSPPLESVESPLQSLRDLVVDGYVIFEGFKRRRPFY